MKAKWKCVVIDWRQQISADKSKQTSTSLEIRFHGFGSWGFHCSSAVISFLSENDLEWMY